MFERLTGFWFGVMHWGAYRHSLEYWLRYLRWRIEVAWWVHQLNKGNPAAPERLWILCLDGWRHEQ